MHRKALSSPLGRAVAALVFVSALLGATGLSAVTLDSVEPAVQAVHGFVVLRGSDFGSFVPGLTKVVFRTPDGSVSIDAPRPYVWRDDYIQIRVPVGQGSDRIPQSELVVEVDATGGVSNSVGFQVLVRGNSPLSYEQRTQIVANADVSGFLGDPDDNKARSKDGDVGDVNGDGWPDLIDNNSNNNSNDTHTVLHLNLGGEEFNSMNWEPVNSGDNGNFVVTVLPGGVYHENGITYDADFVDLNNDELVDWVQASSSPSRIRLVMNNYQGVPGSFVEATNDWFGNQNPPGSPDDISHTDVNYDGFVDIGSSYRFSSEIEVFYNDNGVEFDVSRTMNGTGSVSFHDMFFIDADADGWVDIIGANENSDSQLFLNNGNLPHPTFTKDSNFQDDAHSGIAADFNGDGLEDFVLTELASASVYSQQPAQPGIVPAHRGRTPRASSTTPRSATSTSTATST